VRLARRIQRDVQERGRDVAAVIEQYTRVRCVGVDFWFRSVVFS
jgi:uridine kinase